MNPVRRFHFSNAAISTNKHKKPGFVKRRGKMCPIMIPEPNYVTWKQLADLELIRQPGFPRDADFLWSADIFIPGKFGEVDIDNCIKCLFDALVRNFKIPDDRRCVDLRIRYFEGDEIVIFVKAEDVNKWKTVINLTKNMIKKLGKFLP